MKEFWKHQSDELFGSRSIENLLPFAQIFISDKPIGVKAGMDLPIVARPTPDSREVLTRIAQKETRRVMVFEREREKGRYLDLVGR